MSTKSTRTMILLCLYSHATRGDIVAKPLFPSCRNLLPLTPCDRTFILFAVQALLGAATAVQFLMRAGPGGGLGHRRHTAPAMDSAYPSIVDPAGPGLGTAAEGSTACRDGPWQLRPATAWGSSSRREFSTLEKLFSTLFVTVLCNELAIMVLYCGYCLDILYQVLASDAHVLYHS